MNCDQAFDYLTDSARRDSSALARHLAGCTRCRQLKDTLEPALDLFDDLVPEPGIGSLEGAPRATTEESIRIAEQSAARLSQRRRLSALWLRNAVRYAAVFLIGAALVFALTTMSGQHSGDSVPAGSICPWKNRAHADNANLEARNVVMTCIDCHIPPPAPADNNSALRLNSLRRSLSLALLSSDWFTTSELQPADAVLSSASWEVST